MEFQDALFTPPLATKRGINPQKSPMYFRRSNGRARLEKHCAASAQRPLEIAGEWTAKYYWPQSNQQNRA
jgi:hypothetical protein